MRRGTERRAEPATADLVGFFQLARSVAEAPPRDDDDDAADAFQIQTLENDALPLDEALSTRMNEEGSPALPTK